MGHLVELRKLCRNLCENWRECQITAFAQVSARNSSSSARIPLGVVSAVISRRSMTLWMGGVCLCSGLCESPSEMSCFFTHMYSSAIVGEDLQRIQRYFVECGGKYCHARHLALCMEEKGWRHVFSGKYNRCLCHM